LLGSQFLFVTFHQGGFGFSFDIEVSNAYRLYKILRDFRRTFSDIVTNIEYALQIKSWHKSDVPFLSNSKYD